MNSFDIRARKDGTRFFAEYRLSHWSGHKQVRKPDGTLQYFGSELEARKAAEDEFLAVMNGNPRFWRGSSTADARNAAEALFRQRMDDGEAQS